MTEPTSHPLDRDLPPLSPGDFRRWFADPPLDAGPAEGFVMSNRRLASIERDGLVVIEADFRDVELRELGLSRARLESVHWRNGAWVRTVLTDTELVGCALHDVQMTGATFERCTFTRCTISLVRAEQASFRDCRFVDCTFVRYQLVGGEMSSCRWSSCQLVQLEAESSTWSSLQLDQTVLEGTTLTGVRTEGLSLQQCQVRGLRVLGGSHGEVVLQGGVAQELAWYDHGPAALRIRGGEVIDFRVPASLPLLEVVNARVHLLSMGSAGEVAVTGSTISAWSFKPSSPGGAVSIEESVLHGVAWQGLDGARVSLAHVGLEDSFVVEGCRFAGTRLVDVRHAEGLRLTHDSNQYPPGAPTLEVPHAP